jgi:hypothetical protein
LPWEKESLLATELEARLTQQPVMARADKEKANVLPVAEIPYYKV